MGIKKVVKYSVGMAVAGIAGYELARMVKKTPGTREARMQTREYAPSQEERMERTETMESRENVPQEPSDPRDYRSIYRL